MFDKTCNNQQKAVKLLRALVLTTIFLIFLSGLFLQNSYAAVPDWIKNTALWYGEGKISETEFLNAIRYLVDNGILNLNENQVIAHPDSSDTTQELIEQGVEELQNSNNVIALEFFNAALEKDPKDIQAMINKGIILARQGNFNGAKQLFDNAIKLTEQRGTVDYRAVVNAGIVMSIYGDPNEAIKYFDRALANDDKLRQETLMAALINKGVTLMEQGHYEDSLPYFDRALEIEPDRIGALVNKANALQELHRDKEAFPLFIKAHQLSKDPLSWKPKFVIVKAVAMLK
ncbi:MAG: tetratricopeptide repeat protein [Nitrosarchaeum sp.]|nr:tetratricopeptide repeat protein [Nitrosarchaeum sp.]MCA9820628.1 tetratricopeptide repeat protein [Nitrosarchaeum sp.]